MSGPQAIAGHAWSLLDGSAAKTRLTLQLRESPPYPVRLSGLEGVLETLLPDPARAAHSLGSLFPHATLGRCFGVVHAEEEQRRIVQAGCLRSPLRFFGYELLVHDPMVSVRGRPVNVLGLSNVAYGADVTRTDPGRMRPCPQT